MGGVTEMNLFQMLFFLWSEDQHAGIVVKDRLLRDARHRVRTPH